MAHSHSLPLVGVLFAFLLVAGCLASQDTERNTESEGQRMHVIADKPLLISRRHLLDTKAASTGTSTQSDSTTKTTPTPRFHVCAYVSLLSPLDASGKLTYTFGRGVNCKDVAAYITKSISAEASALGVTLTAPFTVKICQQNCDGTTKPPSMPHVMACGAFASADESLRLQASIEKLLGQWSMYTVGVKVEPGSTLTFFCPPAGLTVSSAIAPADPMADGIIGFLQTNCGNGVIARRDDNATCVASSSTDAPFSVRDLYVLSKPTQKTYNTICTRVGKRQCDPAATCCGMNAAKLTIRSNEGCLGMTALATVNGKKVKVDWNVVSQTLEVTLPNGSLSKAAGAEVCIAVPSAGPCSQPKDLCPLGVCPTRISSADSQCCQE